LASVEVLDSPNGYWRTGPSLILSRANTHAVVSADEQVVYVLGGYHGSQFLGTMEVLESESLGWRNWRLPPRELDISTNTATVDDQNDDAIESSSLHDSSHNSSARTLTHSIPSVVVNSNDIQ